MNNGKVKEKSPLPNSIPKGVIPVGIVPTDTNKAAIPPFKRPSEAELQAKREKGLCFHCNERYTIGHPCKNKELYIMVICGEEGLESEEEEAPKISPPLIR